MNTDDSRARLGIVRLGAAQWRIAIALTAAMMVIYSGTVADVVTSGTAAVRTTSGGR